MSVKISEDDSTLSQPFSRICEPIIKNVKDENDFPPKNTNYAGSNDLFLSTYEWAIPFNIRNTP